MFLTLALVLCVSFTSVLASDYEFNVDFSNGQSLFKSMGGTILAITDDEAQVGETSLYVRARTQVWEGVEFDFLSVLEEGGVYDISIWVKLAEGAEEGTKGWFTLVMTDLDEESEYSRLGDEIELSTSEWVEIRAEGFEFTKEGMLDIKTYIEVSDRYATYYVDNFTISGDKPINITY